jgi:hypothetical protein
MSSAGEGQEQELAELLKEVRALRGTLEQLKGTPGFGAGLASDYAVLVRSQPAFSPDYAVAVRMQAQLAPDYAVLVRQASDEPPSYEVLVRPATGEFAVDPGPDLGDGELGSTGEGSGVEE